MRDREYRASYGCDNPQSVPEFPGRVKDSRGRLIPARVRKFVEEAPKDATPRPPFVPLKLVVEPAPPAEAEAQGIAGSAPQIEVHGPGGFVVKVSELADTDYVAKLLKSLEAKS